MIDLAMTLRRFKNTRAQICQDTAEHLVEALRLLLEGRLGCMVGVLLHEDREEVVAEAACRRRSSLVQIEPTGLASGCVAV